MMKTNILLAFSFFLALSILIPGLVSAQDCKYLLPTKLGTTLEYTYYNKKGREDSYQTQKVVEVRNVDDATVIKLESSVYSNKKKDDAVVTNFELKCEDGNFFINMNDFSSTANYEQYEGSPDMDVEIESKDLFYPSNMSVGETLPEGSMEISVKNSGMRLFGTTITIKDRKVEAKETITTSAGTFECLKITSVIITKSVMTMESKTVQWLAEDIGIVKTENLTKNGKLVGSQVLTGISK